MSAATSLAISASLNSSNAANSAAQRAKTEACKITVDRFDSLTATVQGKQIYADCIDRLYPAAMDPGQVIAMKVAICLIFSAFVVGLILGFSDEGFSIWMLLTGLVFALLAVLVVFVIGLSVVGIAFLVTA